jgi:hypothetical protein
VDQRSYARINAGQLEGDDGFRGPERHRHQPHGMHE